MNGVRKRKLQFEPMRALVRPSCDLGDLWHKRMTHLHCRAFNVLRDTMTALLKISAKRYDPYKGCAKSVLDLIDSDVCGPMPFVSLSIIIVAFPRY